MMMKVHRVVAVGLCSAGLFAGGLAFSGAPALGFFVHPYLSKIAEANGSALGQPWQLTFDSGGNLLVPVPGETQSVVDVFNSSDVFTGQLSLAGRFVRSVAVGATGDVYVGELSSSSGAAVVDVFKPEGGGKYKLLQEKELVQGVEYLAIDNSSGPHRGEVYVLGNAITAGIQVQVTDAEGKLVGPGTELPQSEEGYAYNTLEGGPEGYTEDGMAIDGATGKLYLANPRRGFVDEYNAAHVYQGHLSGPSGSFEPVALAVEESTGDLYVVDAANKVVDQFDASGKYIGKIAETSAGPLSIPVGLAVNSSGHVYVSDAGVAVVDVFGASVPAPEVTTGAASVVLSQRTTVKLEGVVNPEGEEVISCEFEYGTSTAYGHTAACTPAPGSGSAPVPVSAEVSGLALGTTYHYRLVAAGPKATNPSMDRTFATDPPVPGLQTEAASGVEQPAPETIIATLNGTLEPAGADTHYYFEWGETEAYGSVSPALPGTDAGEAFGAVHAQAQIGGLKPTTVYYFRLVASNSFGTTRGAGVTFFTPAREFRPQVIGGLPASNVSQFAATLNDTIETREAIVDYHYEYGTSTAYGSIAPIPDNYTPITSQPVAIVQPIFGLQAGTTYHYRLIASGPGGTNIAGPDETFTTLTVPPPTVNTGGSEGVGVGQATLTGAVDPHGWDTTYLFEYGPSTAYGASWPTVQVDMGALEGAQPVVVNVPNLLPGTIYHYRLVASNGGGTSYGPDMTFATGEYPAQVIQEPMALRTLLVPSGEIAKAPAKKGKKTKKKGKQSKAHHSAKHGHRRKQAKRKQ
ncbi:MAG: hypothetical protein ACRDLF_10410 [Solirubrobacteraceae bacterium]